MKKKIIGLLLIISLLASVLSGLSSCKLLSRIGKLQTPEFHPNSGECAVWDKIDNSNGYDIEINGVIVESVSADIYYYELESGDTIRVRAKGGIKLDDSDWSKPHTYIYTPKDPPITLKAPVISVDAYGNVTWPRVDGATGYAYRINGGVEIEILSNNTSVRDGNTIEVKALGRDNFTLDSLWSNAITYHRQTENNT